MEWIGDLERAFAAVVYPNRVVIAIAGAVALVVLAWVAWRRGWARVLQAHPRATAVSVAALFAIGAPVAWYLASPLFISSRLDEPAPVVIGGAMPAPARASPASPPASPSGPPLGERLGEFMGADEFHFGRGTARLIETAPGTWVLRLEEFHVRNGPDLFVYLSESPDGYAKGGLELGPLKADRGNQNYDVPVDTEVGAFRSVVIWCRAFSVQFASARLS